MTTKLKSPATDAVIKGLMERLADAEKVIEFYEDNASHSDAFTYKTVTVASNKKAREYFKKYGGKK